MVRATSLNRNFAYHGNTNYDARLEVVPGGGPLRHFLDVDCHSNRNVTTFYVLLHHPPNGVAEEAIEGSVRVWWTGGGTNGQEYVPMTWVANPTLTPDAPFHGFSAFSKTLELWQAEWHHPTNNAGLLKSPLEVYYAPLLRTVFGSQKYQTDYAWLVAKQDTGTGYAFNNYPPTLSTTAWIFVDHDYHYTHQWRDEGDVDGDGMPNWFEDLYFGGNDPPDNDPDHDGIINLNEYIADTNPKDPASYFAKTITQLKGEARCK